MEMLIVLTAIAVIATVSVPGFNALSKRYQLKETSYDILSSLNLAQTEAKQRASTVTVCPTSDGFHCRADGDWNRGWLLYADRNANQMPDSNEILESYGPPRDSIRIHAYGSFSLPLNFNGAGLLSEQNDPATGGFLVCYANGEKGYREVQIDENGLVNLQKSDEACGGNDRAIPPGPA